ncbi:MAG: hypothetical protein ABIF77_01620 [bacterium]
MRFLVSTFTSTRECHVVWSWLLCFGIICVPGSVAHAETTWRSLRKIDDTGSVALRSAGQEFNYCLLVGETPTTFEIRGPRRLKIISRYLFGPDDPPEQVYTVRVLSDGKEILRKAFTGREKPELQVAGENGGSVSTLHRCYVEVGTGLHTIQVFGETAGDGRIAARFFRQTQARDVPTTTFAPESFANIYSLHFASGAQSTYYHFDADQPLVFMVNGPTTLTLYTRLDFDHTMNGSQSYSLEVSCDNEVWQTFHYHTDKLSSAHYLERQDILPGERKSMRIPVTKGSHRFTIQCVRPSGCGISAQIRIPLADIAASQH